MIDITSGLRQQQAEYERLAAELAQRVPDQLADLLQVERQLARQLADVRERIEVRRRHDQATAIARHLGELIARHEQHTQPTHPDAALASTGLIRPRGEAAAEQGATADGMPVAGQATTETRPQEVPPPGGRFQADPAPLADGHGTAGQEMTPGEGER